MMALRARGQCCYSSAPRAQEFKNQKPPVASCVSVGFDHRYNETKVIHYRRAFSVAVSTGSPARI
jgi:hypothetical protein